MGLTSGLERSLVLLDPARRPPSVPMVDGYLDLLGDAAPEPTGVVQRSMLTRAVPRVYERYWRPALGRVAKGPLGPGMAEERRIARLLLGLGPGDGVLDLACGTGGFARDFGRLVGPSGLVVGLDASATMLARAVRATPPAAPVAYVRGDAAALPFRDASFDAVCCFAALHLFRDPLAALDEIARVLAPGGRVAILTSCRTRTAAARAWDGFVGARLGVRMFEREEVTGALAARGFDPVRRRVAGLAQFVGGRRRRVPG